MQTFDTMLESMTFDFFSTGSHKTSFTDLLLEDNPLFLDVRTQEELETLSFPLSHHLQVLQIPVAEIPKRLKEIPTDRPVGVFCASGVRSSIAYYYLQSHGYSKVRIIEGGCAELVSCLKPGMIGKQIKAKKEI
jgi:rhodanese-related sulfurtransferase